nr:atlastin-2-like isoform X2 [Styela clava]
MYNVKNELNANNMDCFRHFTDHTKLYQKHWEDDDTELENSFQDLTLVVRDWENDDEYGWDKGHKHMEKQVGKYKVLKDHMKKSYSNIRCFILPHPGMSVIRSKEGKIKEIETSFVNQLLPLFSKVLNPTTIKPFRIGGSIRSGRYWIDMANGFVIALQKTGRLKLKNMTENMGDEPITEEEIMRIHEDAVTTTMATFDEKKKRIIGTDKTDKQKLKECILNNVEGLFNKYKDRNAKHIKTIEGNLRYEIQGIVQAYRENMLTESHQSIENTLERFDGLMALWNEGSEQIVSYRGKLNIRIKDKKQYLSTKNEEVKKTVESDIAKFAITVKEQYETTKDKIIQTGYVLEDHLLQHHKSLAEILLSHCRVRALPVYNVDENFEFFVKFKKDIIAELQTKFEAKHKLNADNHSFFTKILRWLSNKSSQTACERLIKEIEGKQE